MKAAGGPVKAQVGPAVVPASGTRMETPGREADKPLLSVEAVKRHVAGAMEKLRADDIEEMFAVLKRHALNQPPVQDFATAEGLYRKLRAKGYEVTGEAVGEVECVREEAVGTSFFKLTYIEKFERQVIVIRLTYYRPAKSWRLYDMTWELSPPNQTVNGLFTPTLPAQPTQRPAQQ
ncbi:hypothetical protein FRUB_08555 [Fimbriiglobus ruber]|uniref:Uncharacterized protein n=1 Tax=Fimbriiglobus ruber TaxID=1908690 RepID=A0A225D3A9_9BACT|nr:hypothetical protein FRUB_08555 [Fimbriiglobus ruber]